jgi:trehalose 6-phosphate phosphatase
MLCTDFDGSLAPIVEEPQAARAVPGAGEALSWLSRQGAADGLGARCPTRVAVITARDAEDAAARVSLGPEAVVVGNQGLDRLVRGRLTLTAAVIPWIPVLDAARASLAAALAAGRAPGARLERKRCSLVVHSRGAESPGIMDETRRLAEEVAARTGLSLGQAKQAVELRVPVHRDKATAVRALRRGPWRASALCTAGDDYGDVRMLQLAEAMPDRGTAVAVIDAETPAAVAAAASWRIRGPWEWAATLQLVAQGLRAPA